jgi:RNA polymerase sigma factor (sigma-70 family)
VEGWPELSERRPLRLNRNYGELRSTTDDALLEAFLNCRQVLSRFIARVVAPGDIEDIVQETFIRSMQAGVERRIDHPRAFMFRTARNLAFNHVQRFDNKVRPHMVDYLDEEVQPASETLEAQFESQERFINFCRAINQLPVKCRRAFILRKVYGLTQKEVAEYLEMTEANVEKHVSRGLMRCIEYMKGIDGRKSDAGRESGQRIKSGAR